MKTRIYFAMGVKTHTGSRYNAQGLTINSIMDGIQTLSREDLLDASAISIPLWIQFKPFLTPKIS